MQGGGLWRSYVSPNLIGFGAIACSTAHLLPEAVTEASAEIPACVPSPDQPVLPGANKDTIKTLNPKP